MSQPPKLTILRAEKLTMTGTKAHLTLLFGLPEHGKTLALTTFLLPLELNLRKNAGVDREKTQNPLAWMLPKEPILKKTVRLDLYDPKRNTIHYIPESEDACYEIHEHESASEALQASFESEENGVCVLEEAMTIPRKEHATLRHFAAIRRRGIDSQGPGIYLTTQRPVNIPPDLIAMPDYFLIGKMIKHRDVAAVAEIADEQIMDILPKLPPRTFIAHRI